MSVISKKNNFYLMEKNLETFSTSGLQQCDPAKTKPCNDETKICSSPPGIDDHFCYQQCDKDYNDCNDENSKCLLIPDVEKYLCVNNLDEDSTNCHRTRYGVDKKGRNVNYCQIGHECIKHPTTKKTICMKTHTNKTHTQADIDNAVKAANDACPKCTKTHTQADIDAAVDAKKCPTTTCDKTHTQADIDNAVKAANDACPKCTKTHTQDDIDAAVADKKCPTCNKTHTQADVNKAKSDGIEAGKGLVNCNSSPSTVLAFESAKKFKTSTIVLGVLVGLLLLALIVMIMIGGSKSDTSFSSF